MIGAHVEFRIAETGFWEESPSDKNDQNKNLFVELLLDLADIEAKWKC